MGEKREPGLVVPPVSVILYFKNVRRRYRQELELHSGLPIETGLILTDEGIEFSNANEEVFRIGYSNIKKTRKTKNYYVFVTEAKQIYCFKKDGFITGSLEEFCSFLKGKGFKV